MDLFIEKKALQALKKKTKKDIETFFWGSAKKAGKRKIFIEWINILENHNYEKRGSHVAKPKVSWYNGLISTASEMEAEFIFIGHTHPGTCYHAGVFSDGDDVADKFDNQVFRKNSIKFLSLLYSPDLDKLQARWIKNGEFKYYNIYSIGGE